MTAFNDVCSLAWITTARYNSLNQLIEQIQSEVALATGGNLTPTTRLQYDLLGLQIVSIVANGNLNCVRYDAAGQLIEERQTAGARRIFQPWRMGYLASGQVTPNSDQLRLPNRPIIADQNSISHRNHLHVGF